MYAIHTVLTVKLIDLWNEAIPLNVAYTQAHCCVYYLHLEELSLNLFFERNGLFAENRQLLRTFTLNLCNKNKIKE